MSNKSFEELIAEGNAANVNGWDFSWFDGRATEDRPSWGFSKLLGQKIASATASLDIQTGGGEVLNTCPSFPRIAVATESWAPNVALASKLLNPRGVVVVSNQDQPPLPFADQTFDFVSSRHPVKAYFSEIARVLKPGGTYFAQHVGHRNVCELYEYFLGPQPPNKNRVADVEAAEAEAEGLEVVDLRLEKLKMEFMDVGAVVVYLRKVIWTVPGFTTEGYMSKLKEMHQHIQEHGSFVCYSRRFLIEARKK